MICESNMDFIRFDGIATVANLPSRADFDSCRTSVPVKSRPPAASTLQCKGKLVMCMASQDPHPTYDLRIEPDYAFYHQLGVLLADPSAREREGGKGGGHAGPTGTRASIGGRLHLRNA
jgi:hypothetical protein